MARIIDKRKIIREEGATKVLVASYPLGGKVKEL